MRIAAILAALTCTACVPSTSSGGGSKQDFDGPFLELAVNAKHTCLLAADGALRCFGGDDTRNPPMTPLPSGKFRDLVSARRFACALAEDGTIACFGACLSNGCKAPPGHFEGLALHDDQGGCAWDQTRTVCWGDDVFVNGSAPPPELLTKPVQAIVFGPDWSLIHYADGTIRPHGQRRPAGEQGVWNDPLLTGLAERGEVVAGIAGRGAAACVIDTAHKARCVAYYDNQTPPDASNVLAVEFSSPMGAMPACVLFGESADARAGKVSCTANVLRKTLTLPGRYTQLGVGDHHICGLTEAGKVECVGDDRFGAVSGRNPWP